MKCCAWSCNRLLIQVNLLDMKIVRFAVAHKVQYGILKGESIQAIEGRPFRSIRLTDQRYRLSDVKLLSPCTPSKLRLNQSLGKPVAVWRGGALVPRARR